MSKSKTITITLKVPREDGSIISKEVDVQAKWDEGCKDWLLGGDALRKLDEEKARLMFRECLGCSGPCNIDICKLNKENKEKRWGKNG
jgi:hypothetical protein